jgi:hypothetical protein
MHARFLFCVLPIVPSVVRAPLVKSVGRIFYVHGRPAKLVSWSVVDRARSRPAVAGCCAVLCCAVLCTAGACRILSRVATWPDAAVVGL